MADDSGWLEGEFLGFDLETTGVDRFSDVPVSYALVSFKGPSVVHTETGIVNPGRPIPSGAIEVHGITDERAQAEGQPLEHVIEMLTKALCDASMRGVPTVGMKLDYDLTMLDSLARRILGRGLAESGYTGPVLDTLVIDRHVDKYRKGKRQLGDLCTFYEVSLEDAHDAAADATAAVRVLQSICSSYPVVAAMGLGDLHHAQMEWHRAWAVSFDDWLQKQGRAGLDPRDFDWPISSPTA